MKRRHLKIVNPVRFFIFIFICIMVMIFAGYGIMGAGSADAATARTYEQVVISDGDTLWNLAETYNEGVNKSTRDIVYEICDINNIDLDDIQPGDKVVIPVY